MKKKILIIGSFLFAIILSCKKFDRDSIYEPINSNKPSIQNLGYEINGDSLTFMGQISNLGSSELLRYGHLWGDNPSLNFINSYYLDSSVTVMSNFQLAPISVLSKTKNFDRSKSLYFIAFAINEAGISYSDVGSVNPQLIYDRYKIVQEQNADNKINPGETVKLRFYFKNNSPINSIGTKVSLITNSSSYITSINPLQNIVLSPQLVSNSNESYFETQLVIDGNTPNVDLPIPITLVDANGSTTSFSGNKIQIKIN